MMQTVLNWLLLQMQQLYILEKNGLAGRIILTGCDDLNIMQRRTCRYAIE